MMITTFGENIIAKEFRDLQGDQNYAIEVQEAWNDAWNETYREENGQAT